MFVCMIIFLLSNIFFGLDNFFKTRPLCKNSHLREFGLHGNVKFLTAWQVLRLLFYNFCLHVQNICLKSAKQTWVKQSSRSDTGSLNPVYTASILHILSAKKNWNSRICISIKFFRRLTKQTHSVLCGQEKLQEERIFNIEFEICVKKQSIICFRHHQDEYWRKDTRHLSLHWIC